MGPGPFSTPVFLIFCSIPYRPSSFHLDRRPQVQLWRLRPFGLATRWTSFRRFSVSGVPVVLAWVKFKQNNDATWLLPWIWGSSTQTNSCNTSKELAQRTLQRPSIPRLCFLNWNLTTAKIIFWIELPWWPCYVLAMFRAREDYKATVKFWIPRPNEFESTSGVKNQFFSAITNGWFWAPTETSIPAKDSCSYCLWSTTGGWEHLTQPPWFLAAR